MPIEELSGAVQYVMDLIGIFAFALSGAFLAVRKDFDIFGTVILSEAAGLGGGLFRDLVLGITPVAFTDLGYFFTPCVAALIVYFGYRLRHDEKVYEGKPFDISDAAALGLFSVTGTIKALSHGLNSPAAVTLGSASAVGGGVLAYLLALEQPTLLRWNRDLYALPAFVGAISVAMLYNLALLNVGTAIGASLFAFVLRLLALRYSWRTPRSQFWRNPFVGMRQQPPAANPAPDLASSMQADMATLPSVNVGRSTPPPSATDTVTLRRIDMGPLSRRGDGVQPTTPKPGPDVDPRLLLHLPARRDHNGQDRASPGR
ncbi:trimeric intracellular cation channel family protein [Streptomyces sp. Tu102]|uniref:trimeric intracellular cation channel family protein n=1 Tax=Streptomyces TaxID=1883 RepID=UPI001BDBD353|nr:trimeric intracellular cation channel family protein [Streptomyces sp. Tu102]MBT1093501.1 trimeric intracellular cation channel family protein [Streptomyces sp. Tu102]